MEFLIMALACVLFVIIVFSLEAYRAKKEEKRFIEKLYHDYVSLSNKNYTLERFEKIRSYYERHQTEGQIDDITWNDLGMDELFKRMNYTLSASGEEFLYYQLRTPEPLAERQVHFEQVVSSFGENPDARVRFQYTMKLLGHTGKYSIYDYIDNLDYLGERKNWKHYIIDLLYLPLIALLWIRFSWGIIGLIVLMIYNIIGYFKEKSEIEPYITSFAYVIRLLDVSKKIERLPLKGCEEEEQNISKYRKRLQKLERNSYLVMSSNKTAAASGDILAVIMDYMRMVFHVDLIKFNNMLQFLRDHIDDVDQLVTTVGYLETAVATWIFRESLENGWCKPVIETKAENLGQADRNCDEKTPSLHIRVLNGYHPLLTDPVKNSIDTDRGVLLTGSNASGKSTFLKMIALNTILAQTIHTCCADVYQAPFFHVYSSMTLRDDIKSGESYYIVEIKALKRILDAAVKNKPILCFVDEVLRGTNTVERIAASSQILKSLGKEGILCFAATHDIELTDLLSGIFRNYHFEEEVREGDIYFNYQLQKGKATTRNAIRLLELLGYQKEIVDNAMRQAEGFIQNGSWEIISSD